MSHPAATIFEEGHRLGGLLSFGAATMGAMVLAACGTAGGPTERVPGPTRRPVHLEAAYGDLGLVTGPAEFPVVGSLSTLAGSADSTVLLLGLSLPPAALRFQREGAAFEAGYVVSVRLSRGGRVVRLVEGSETVRVRDFAETARTEPGVLFQTGVQLEPGRYEVGIRIRDARTARGAEMVDTVDVPRLGPDGGRLAGPVLVHGGRARLTREAEPRLILNPRHAVPYGGEPPRVYLEAYGDSIVTLELRDENGGVAWRRRVSLEPAADLAGAVVELPADSLSLGRYTVAAAAGGESPRPVPLLVTLSDHWLAANFGELLQVLRYIASPDELRALREGTPRERREGWQAFWGERDPVPATPVNEFREDFFQRVAVAREEFGEPGRPGWRTDRGEVYIVLGPPTRFAERRRERNATSAGESDTQEWTYDRPPGAGRLRLLFVDRTGSGAYRLTPASESAFREVVDRLKERPGRP